MNILMVEDDQDTRELLSELLEMHGHQTYTANEAQQALQCLQQRPDIDLLITDVTLPGESGIELAKATKTIRPTVDIIICSGYGEQQCETLPFSVAWVQKPVEMDFFLQTVDRLAKKDT